jgi:hypothetical protein
VFWIENQFSESPVIRAVALLPEASVHRDSSCFQVGTDPEPQSAYGGGHGCVSTTAIQSRWRFRAEVAILKMAKGKERALVPCITATTYSARAHAGAYICSIRWWYDVGTETHRMSEVVGHVSLARAVIRGFTNVLDWGDSSGTSRHRYEHPSNHSITFVQHKWRPHSISDLRKTSDHQRL